ncbi:MAG: hypothetical protein HC853_05645 [Anaerolineae bacterium]|nr:hypothetical protein [Anaerolineae bacterium]
MIQLNMMNPTTREFGAEVGFQFTPTFILFDGEGKELKRWRTQPPELVSCRKPAGLFVTGYWLLVTGYWLLVTGYWLLVQSMRKSTRKIKDEP